MLLIIFRNNLKQSFVGFLFGTTQQVVSQAIESVSQALIDDFVRQNLGYYHLTRDEIINLHSRPLVNKALQEEENRMRLVADCTYIYIEKPGDLDIQRKTFFLHKKRNLYKFQFITSTTGKIIDVDGPYFCDIANNDASVLSHHFQNSDILLLMEPEDILVVDRGYQGFNVATWHPDTRDLTCICHVFFLRIKGAAATDRKS